MRLPVTFRGSPRRSDPSPALDRGGSPAGSGAPIRPTGSSIQGFLDGVDGAQVWGWAFDLASPGQRVLIEVTAGRDIEIVVADVHRRDLEQAGKGDGRHGFLAVLPTPVDDGVAVRARVVSTGQELSGSPIRSDLLTSIERSGEGLLDRLRAEAHRARLVMDRGPRS